jgi:peptidoglycan/LPS O-acetylase OafA/YrhL
MDQDELFYKSSIPASSPAFPSTVKTHRGPLLYFAISMITAIILAIPLIVPRSIAAKDDPNPFGYLLILVSFPTGGLLYRLRSRNWPIDSNVRIRQITACCLTILLPLSVALATGMIGQGLAMTYVSGIVSLMVVSGILISGRRRWRPN